jgi:hypothetical protein
MVVRPAQRVGVVEVYAPAGVTREGRPVTAQAPAVSHEAAQVRPVVVAPIPVRNAGQPYPGRPSPATVGAPPVVTPVPAPASAPNGTVTVRQLPPPAAGQPPIQPVLRPEPARGGPPPWSNGQDRGNKEPILRPVPRGEPGPNPAAAQPAQAQPAPTATRGPVADDQPSRRTEPPPGHAAKPKKVDPQEKKGHPDPRER